jgi:hypothetical protein
MKSPLLTGFFSALVGGIGILVHGLNNLSKGEANASYAPSALSNTVGIILSLLFWGGVLLMIYAFITHFTNRK